MFKKFRRKLARLIFVEDVPQNVVPIRRHKMADEVDREYEERMARHDAEAERLQGKRPLTAVK